MANKLKKWTEHEFSSGGYRLHKFNKYHYCFSAVLQDEETGSYVYVSVGSVLCMGLSEMKIRRVS